MPVYSFKGLASNGKQISGVKDADNLRSLKANLKRDGIYLTTAREANLRATELAGDLAIGAVSLFRPGLAFRMWRDRRDADKRQVAVLTRQLGVLLKAGVPLSEALGALVDQA